MSFLLLMISIRVCQLSSYMSNTKELTINWHKKFVEDLFMTGTVLGTGNTQLSRIVWSYKGPMPADM